MTSTDFCLIASVIAIALYFPGHFVFRSIRHHRRLLVELALELLRDHRRPEGGDLRDSRDGLDAWAKEVLRDLGGEQGQRRRAENLATDERRRRERAAARTGGGAS